MKFRDFLNERKNPKIIYPKFSEKKNFVEFDTEENLWKWFNQLPLDAVIDKDIVIGTGEVIFEKKDRVTRRKVLKGQYKKSLKRGKFDSFLYDDELEYSKDYRILKKEVEKMVDEPEKLYQADYDLSDNVPYLIKRKDSNEFNDLDRENIEAYIDYYNISIMPSNIQLFVLFSKNKATIDIEFN